MKITLLPVGSGDFPANLPEMQILLAWLFIKRKFLMKATLLEKWKGGLAQTVMVILSWKMYICTEQLWYLFQFWEEWVFTAWHRMIVKPKLCLLLLSIFLLNHIQSLSGRLWDRQTYVSLVGNSESVKERWWGEVLPNQCYSDSAADLVLQKGANP